MSIQTQIDRISGNVSAALSAIAEKGVTVPDGSNSDALAELIAAIEAGGGASGFAKVATGTITPSSNTSLLQVSHELGQTPDVSIVYCKASAPSSGVFSSIVRLDGKYFNVGKSGSTFYGHSGLAGSVSGSTNLIFPARITSSQSLYFAAGHTYLWIAGVFA